MKSLPQAAESVVDIGEDGAIALLDDELIEEAEAARKRVGINVIMRFVSDFHGGGDAFEVDGGGVARRIRLMVVDESAGLVLLIAQEPAGDLKDEVSKITIAGDFRPLAEGLQQPCDLTEVSFVAKAMAVVSKTPVQTFFVDRGHVLLTCDYEREENLSGKVVLVNLRRWIVGVVVSRDPSMRQLDRAPQFLGKIAH